MSRSASQAQDKKFVDVDRLQNADGLVAVVSQRRKNGELTFAVFREFQGEDGQARTQFVPQRLAKSYQDLVQLAIEAMAQMRATGRSARGPLPYAFGKEAG